MSSDFDDSKNDDVNPQLPPLRVGGAFGSTFNAIFNTCAVVLIGLLSPLFALTPAFGGPYRSPVFLFYVVANMLFGFSAGYRAITSQKTVCKVFGWIGLGLLVIAVVILIIALMVKAPFPY